MRKYVSIIVLLLVAASFVPQLFATPQSKSSKAGLFFNVDDIPALRKKFASAAIFTELRQKMLTVDRDKERRFLRSEVRYNDHLYDIARVGKLAQQMAFLYIFTGDDDAAALATECIETLMKFPKWDYFLEGGEQVIGLQRAPSSALAVSIVVEALGDRVPAAKREQWLRTMAERGIEPCYWSTYGMRYPDRVKGWSMDTTSTYFEHRPGDRGWDLSRWPIILNTINLKAVPASALAISALTYRKYLGADKDTERWIEQAVYSIGTFRDIFARDGSYNEGVSYANYTTLHLVQAITALRRSVGIDMSDLLNWPGYVEFLAEMSLANHDDPKDIINFSDAGHGALSAVAFWVARRNRDGRAQWYGETLAFEHNSWSVLWYDPAIQAAPAPATPHVWESDLEWIVARTGYGVDDLVVAMRSGPPFNHEHADRNSIIVKAFGEKLVVDPNRPPYSYTDPSWVMRLTGGHSAVLIDGQGHQYVDGREGTNSSQAEAHIIRSGERKGYFFWTSDATQAYQLVLPDVKSITRTVLVLYDIPAVVLLDKVIKKETPSRIQARFFGYNNDHKGSVVTTASEFDLIRPLARLVGTGFADGGVTYVSAELPIPKEKAELYPFAEVSTATPSIESFLVTVLMPVPVPGAKPQARIQWDEQGGFYRLHMQNGSQTATCKVYDTGTVPEYEVEF